MTSDKSAVWTGKIESGEPVGLFRSPLRYVLLVLLTLAGIGLAHLAITTIMGLASRRIAFSLSDERVLSVFFLPIWIVIFTYLGGLVVFTHVQFTPDSFVFQNWRRRSFSIRYADIIALGWLSFRTETLVLYWVRHDGESTALRILADKTRQDLVQALITALIRRCELIESESNAMGAFVWRPDHRNLVKKPPWWVKK